MIDEFISDFSIMDFISAWQQKIDLWVGGELLGEYVFAFLVVLASLLVLFAFKMIVLIRLKRVAEATVNDIDDMFVNAVQRVRWPFYLALSLYLGLLFVTLPAWLNKGLDFALMLVFVYYAVKVLQSFVLFLTEKFAAKSDEEKGLSVSGVKAIGKIVEIALWLMAIVFIVSNLGYDVTSLITGLGIGGIAVALAVQSVLGDIFSSFSLYFDQPFKVGDFIMVGDDMGEVKKIGLKSTRIETLQGEELIIPNNVLTGTMVQNFRRMERRRVTFEIGVTYDTPKTKLAKIPDLVREIIDAHKEAETSWVYFKSFGDSALIYEVVFNVMDSEYEVYVKLHEEINLAITKEFDKQKIEMAYPTQTIHVKK